MLRLNTSDVFINKIKSFKEEMIKSTEILLSIDNKLKLLENKISMYDSRIEGHTPSFDLSLKEKSFILDVANYFYYVHSYSKILFFDNDFNNETLDEINDIKSHYIFNYINLFKNNNDRSQATLITKLLRRARYNINLTIATIMINSDIKTEERIDLQAMLYSKCAIIQAIYIKNINKILKLLNDVDVI